MHAPGKRGRARMSKNGGRSSEKGAGPLRSAARATIEEDMTNTAYRRPPTLRELRARRDEILSVARRDDASNLRVFGSVARDCPNIKRAAASVRMTAGFR